MAKKSVKKKDSIRLWWSSMPLPEAGSDITKVATLKTREMVLPLSLSSAAKESTTANRLIHGDNLSVMKILLEEGHGECAELIYIDPPFLSKTDYKHKITIAGTTITRHAYGDRWTRESYLDMLAPRLRLMREFLSDTGKIFVHCDWRTSGLIRILLDEVFGHENFMNELIWHYGGRGAKATSGQFARNHDTIFVYGKTPKARLKKIYTDRVLTEKGARSKGLRKDDDGRYFKTAPRGDYTDESIERLEAEGRIHRTSSGKVRVKYFLESRGSLVVEKRPVGDVWDDIPDAMHSPLKERTDYGTQKPLALLKRIIECSTESGDLVCDFFSGSGTTPVAASELDRRWLASEVGPIGVQVAKARLAEIAEKAFTVEGLEEEKPSTGRLTIKQPVLKTNAKGGCTIEISLKDYIPCNDTSEDIPEELLKNPLSLIDSWAIDWDYDGKVFKNMWRTTRGAGKDAGEVSLKASVTLKKKPTRISVRTVDIMGGESEVGVEL